MAEPMELALGLPLHSAWQCLYTEPYGSVCNQPNWMSPSRRFRTPRGAAFWSSSSVRTLRSRTLPRSST